MAVYLVDRDLTGVTQEQLQDMQQMSVKMSRRFSREGRPVRYLRSIYIPSESHCFSLFESSSAVFVRDVNEAAQAPFTRIVQVIDLTL